MITNRLPRSLRRRRFLAESATAALALPAARAEEVPPARILEEQRDLKAMTTPISPELREAILALRVFRGGGPNRNGQFVAILAVDCIWCRIQFAANRSLLHSAEVRYALTSMDDKYAGLIDVELLDAFGAAPNPERWRLQDARAQRLFLGLTSADVRRSPDESRIVEEQRQRVKRVTKLLDAAYAPRGWKIAERFPVTFWVDTNLTVARIVVAGYAWDSYYRYMSLPLPRYADEEGRAMLRRFLEPMPRTSGATGGRLGDDVWRALADIQNVPIGGKPFNLRGANAGRHIYVLFDPSDVRSRLLWMRLSLMAFYVKVHWTPVPDLSDPTSIEACVHLARCADPSRLAEEVERLFTLDMLGYQPKPLSPEQTEAEGAALGQALELAERLQPATRSSLPIIVWKMTGGGYYWTSGDVGELELLAIVEASERFTV